MTETNINRILLTLTIFFKGKNIKNVRTCFSLNSNGTDIRQFIEKSEGFMQNQIIDIFAQSNIDIKITDNESLGDKNITDNDVLFVVVSSQTDISPVCDEIFVQKPKLIRWTCGGPDIKWVKRNCPELLDEVFDGFDTFDTSDSVDEFKSFDSSESVDDFKSFDSDESLNDNLTFNICSKSTMRINQI
jgi:hypothetical protein